MLTTPSWTSSASLTPSLIECVDMATRAVALYVYIDDCDWAPTTHLGPKEEHVPALESVRQS